MRWFGRLRRRPAPTTSLAAQSAQQEYLFGEGDAEISRLDMQHFMFRLEFGDDFTAPLSNPAAILDVACGTGRWARDMARRFPGAAVIGFDINREQIDRALLGAAENGDTLPKNCAFVVGDALHPFDFADQRFDFVMARATSAFIPISTYQFVVNEMVRVTRPGGWIELRDFSLVRSQSQALTTMTERFASMTAARGSYPGAGPYLLEYLRGAGLRDAQVKTVTVRSGPQASRGGRLMMTDYLAVMERLTPVIVRSGLASQSEWDQLLAQARQETQSQPSEVDLTAVYVSLSSNGSS